MGLLEDEPITKKTVEQQKKVSVAVKVRPKLTFYQALTVTVLLCIFILTLGNAFHAFGGQQGWTSTTTITAYTTIAGQTYTSTDTSTSTITDTLYRTTSTSTIVSPAVTVTTTQIQFVETTTTIDLP